jgi:hypothetical protein
MAGGAKCNQISRLVNSLSAVMHGQLMLSPASLAAIPIAFENPVAMAGETMA